MSSKDKISRTLADRVAEKREEALDAVVELTAQAMPAGKLSRGERMAAVKQAFEERASRVEEAVRSAGGEVLGKAWINQTLQVRLPSDALAGLADLDEVCQLDAPRKLEPES
jgi:hypothetical protein